MKIIYYCIIGALLFGCSSTKITDSWRNPDYSSFTPKKVLIVGVTENLSARMNYEERLKNELNKRGISAQQSALVFNDDFKNFKQSEVDIETALRNLSDSGFDTVIISAVTGVDERETYRPKFPKTYVYVRRIGRYYYFYQDVYFEPGYYDKHQVYHIETSVYNLKTLEEKSLVWVGSFDITDPKDVSTTIDDYIGAIVNSLENENIIPILIE